MKRSLKDLRADSRDALAGHYGLSFGGVMLLFLLHVLLNQIVLMIPSPSSEAASAVLNIMLSIICAMPLTMLETGLMFMFLNMARYGRPSLNDMFLAFRYESGKAAVLSLIVGAIDTICAVPFTIALTDFILDASITLPGGSSLPAAASVGIVVLSLLALVLLQFVLAYPFSQSIYLYIDHQDYSLKECLSESRRLMRGQKLNYLKLHLSLIGYFAISFLSLGIGYIWTVPYVYVCRANFYTDLSGSYKPY